jgi:hypothetical protein
MLLAVAMAESPATPAPITNTLAGGTFEDQIIDTNNGNHPSDNKYHHNKKTLCSYFDGCW